MVVYPPRFLSPLAGCPLPKREREKPPNWHTRHFPSDFTSAWEPERGKKEKPHCHHKTQILRSNPSRRISDTSDRMAWRGRVAGLDISTDILLDISLYRDWMNSADESTGSPLTKGERTGDLRKIYLSCHPSHMHTRHQENP
jgi:hypothetical protein